MADPVSSFRRYFQDTVDPYVPLGAVYDSFGTTAPPMTPAALIGSIESSVYVLPLLLSGTDHAPIVGVAPFSPTALPGLAAAEGKYLFCGDVTENGVLPGLVRVLNPSFNRTAAVPVLARGDVAAAWAARAAGEPLLEVPAVGVATHDVVTRRAMAIPHEYAQQVLQMYVDGSISWRSLWDTIAADILADAAKEQAYGAFLDYLQVASTARAGAAAGDPVRNPETEMDYPGVRTTPALQEKSLVVARNFLPGMREAVGVGIQLAQVQQNQVTIQQALATAQAPKVATLESEKPELLDTLKRYNEVPSEDHLAAYWKGFAKMQKPEWNSTMNTACRRIAHNHVPTLIPPILPPALTTDIGTGAFTGPHGEVSEGLSIFRMRPGNSPNRKAYRKEERVYTIVGLGTGTAQEDVLKMLLDNEEFELPDSSEQFRGFLEGMYVAAVAFEGANNRAVIAYKAHVLDQRTEIISRIELEYDSHDERRTAWVIIMAKIYRIFNDYNGKLERSPPPEALGERGATVPGAVPPFHEIPAAVADARVESLCKIPSSLFAERSREDSPLAGASTGAGTAKKTTTNAEGGRKEDRRPDQNKNLKTAWKTAGYTSVFGPGSPFHDADSPNGKVVIPSDTQGIRICLPQCLKGVCYDNCTGKHGPLSTGEVKRVAEKGGLTVAGL